MHFQTPVFHAGVSFMSGELFPLAGEAIPKGEARFGPL